MFNSYELLKTKLRTPLLWTLNLLLAAVIFSSAEVGRLLGLTWLPLAISVVWPPTGFSLAAVLLFGNRAWPGVLLGNFSYNFLHLYLHTPEVGSAFVIGATIAIGSLLQALAAGMIIRRFSSGSYFKTVSDIFIFLIPAGLLTCVIASSIGVTTLYLSGYLLPQQIPYTWFTFWLGDSLGVYIFTPLLVVWSLYHPEVRLKEYAWEAIGMLLMFLVVTFLTFGMSYPLANLFLPLSLWVAYRFRMHGATLAIFGICLTSIIATVMGHGFFVKSSANPLAAVVIVLEVLIGTTLIVASIIYEKFLAWDIVKKHNLDLQGSVETQLGELKEMYRANLAKDKLASLGILTSAISRKIQIPLKQIRQFTNESIKGHQHLKESLLKQKSKLNPEIVDAYQKELDSISTPLHKIISLDDEIHNYIGILGKELAPLLTISEEITVKTVVDLNKLLNTCISNVMSAHNIEISDSYISINKELDNSLVIISALPDELFTAFQYILEDAIDSIKLKRNSLGDSFIPKLEIKTVKHHDTVEILIRDNGESSMERLDKYYDSFMEVDLLEELSDIKLAISRDIIEHVHHGYIKVDSTDGEYFQIIITLPTLKL